MRLDELEDCIFDINAKQIEQLKELVLSAKNIIILGNGGSNAISCHIAEDYTKMIGKRTLCFGDSSRMSCYANDYGWENAYQMFLEHFADEDTLVILISSSGESANIINCANYCVDKKLKMITLSGHKPENKLREIGTFNGNLSFWVDSTDYGIVEITHEAILHSII